MTKGSFRLALIAAVLVAILAAPAFGALTGVRLISFTAVRVKNTKLKVLVKWRTGSEPSILGFNIYRVVGTKSTRLGRGVIPSAGSAAGATYSITDTLPKTVKLACYSLQSVDTAGAKVTLAKTCMKK